MFSLGQRLRLLRKANSESLRGLAAAVGLHYSYLSALERDQKELAKLKAEHLLHLAEHFGVSVDYLLGRVPPNVTQLVRAQLARMSPQEQMAFRSLRPEGLRVAVVLRWLVAAGYPDFAPEHLADHLGWTTADFAAVLEGHRAVPESLRQRLAQATGLPERLFSHGDLGPAEETLQELMAHPRGGEYLAAAMLALRAGISPQSLRHLVESLVQEKKAN